VIYLLYTIQVQRNLDRILQLDEQY